MIGLEDADRFDPQSSSQKFELHKWRDGITLEKSGDFFHAAPSGPFVVVLTADCNRWLFASKMLESDIGFNLLVTRIRNFPRFIGIRKQWPPYVGLSFAGFIYGGLHCLAWKAPFPSDIEAMLWRISSVAITSTGVLVALVFMWDIAPPLWGRVSSSLYDRINNFSKEFEHFMGFYSFMEWLEDLERRDNLPVLVRTLCSVLVDPIVNVGRARFCQQGFFGNCCDAIHHSLCVHESLLGGRVLHQSCAPARVGV